MTSRDSSADAFAALVRNAARPGDDDAPLTLTGRQAAQVREALRRADEALKIAERAKTFTITKPCRDARVVVQIAWGMLVSKQQPAGAQPRATDAP